MPYHTSRAVANSANNPDLESTSVSNDYWFSQINAADSLVFDRKPRLELLGSDLIYQYVFNVNSAVHVAPVYVASQNKLYLSQSEPAFLLQLVVNLHRHPPTLSEFPPDDLVSGFLIQRQTRQTRQPQDNHSID